MKSKLLNPRYKVIADYPKNRNPVGTILNLPDFDHDFTKKFWCEDKDQYPHLFQKLEWWEERKLEQLPKYILCNDGAKKIPIAVTEWSMMGCYPISKEPEESKGYYASLCEPLTEREYNSLLFEM